MPQHEGVNLEKKDVTGDSHSKDKRVLDLPRRIVYLCGIVGSKSVGRTLNARQDDEYRRPLSCEQRLCAVFLSGTISGECGLGLLRPIVFGDVFSYESSSEDYHAS